MKKIIMMSIIASVFLYCPINANETNNNFLICPLTNHASETNIWLSGYVSFGYAITNQEGSSLKELQEKYDKLSKEYNELKARHEESLRTAGDIAYSNFIHSFIATPYILGTNYFPYIVTNLPYFYNATQNIIYCDGRQVLP